MKKTWLILIGLILGFNAQAQLIAPQVEDSDSAAVYDYVHDHRSSVRPAANPVARTKPVNVRVVASRGPFKSDPNYVPFQADFMSVMQNNTMPGGTPVLDKFIPLGNQLDPNYVTAPTVAGTGVPQSTIWFACDFWSDEAFVPSYLVDEITSDPNNLFSETEVFNNPQLIFAGQSGGEVWNSDETKTLVTTGFWNAKPLNRFFFLGTASITMKASSKAEADSDVAWVLAFLNFKLASKWSMKENEVVVATGMKVLEAHPSTAPSVTLQIFRSVDTNNVSLKAVGLVGSATLLSTLSLVNPNWTFVSFVSGTNTVEVPKISTSRFFRISVN